MDDSSERDDCIELKCHSSSSNVIWLLILAPICIFFVNKNMHFWHRWRIMLSFLIVLWSFICRITRKVISGLRWNFQITSYWANLEMIAFWAPTPLRRGLPGCKIFHWWFSSGWSRNKATKFSVITRQTQGRLLWVKHTLQPKGWAPSPNFLIPVISTLQPL